MENKKIILQVPQPVRTEFILGDYRFNRLIAPLPFYSYVLGGWNIVPVRFVNDTESIPFFKGTNREAGVIHDFVCRSNFRVNGAPITKITAAKVYYEIQDYFDQQESGNIFNRGIDYIDRGFKSWFVAICPDSVYWQKFTIEATYEEISGNPEPITIENAFD